MNSKFEFVPMIQDADTILTFIDIELLDHD